jgi:hypothetical protein
LGRLLKKSVKVRGSLEVFVTSFFYGEELLTPRPTPKLEGHPLFSVRDCLFNIFAANLHPQLACSQAKQFSFSFPPKMFSGHFSSSWLMLVLAQYALLGVSALQYVA